MCSPWDAREQPGIEEELDATAGFWNDQGLEKKRPSPLAARILKRYFPASDHELIIGTRRTTELAEEFGTPLYIYDAEILRQNLRDVRGALGPRVGILYALKANPSIAVTSVLRGAGAGGEVASAGEILIALRAGLTGAELQFAGPGKHGADITSGIREGVLFNVESSAELRAIAATAEHEATTARVALRINPPASVSGSRMRMSGGSTKFGFDADKAVDAAVQTESLAGVELRGLHTYAGTQTFDADGWLTHASILFDVAEEVEQEIGRPLASLNFGGGFGVPVFDRDEDFDLSHAGTGLQNLISERDPNASRQYFVELGRFLTAVAGVYVSRVTYVKENRGIQHAILDGGMHQHAAAAGVGTVLRKPFPMIRADRMPQSKPLPNSQRTSAQPTKVQPTKVQLGGPLCTPADSFPTSSALGPLEEGALVAFLSSGAYGLTFSQTRFLSHPTPAEVLVDGPHAAVIRDRGAIDDALHGQHKAARVGS